ncbi:ChaC-like protein [Necator americanus]|uniref:glutathione-specific gamma-glutamylcyclotransferase n=1 Tax=Necator americanus TaxID=51031 RepID=W2SY49_NECAM|nr:ChaC-like protein [Necator americanus]ETN74694.1 ChaC-like protein [Necator americanus]
MNNPPTSSNDMEIEASTSKDYAYFFGYGSLIWNPGFTYHHKEKGYANGFARRMYQGNTYHRGNTQQPGRVATLVEDEDSFTTGVVFEVRGKESIRQAFVHLWEREINNGYNFVEITVELADSGDVINAWTCIAGLDNEFYLGDADLEQMAGEIRRAKGCAGPNFEYVLKLAEHVRLLFPEDRDEHLFELENRIRRLVTVYA